jgi:hypothetical protein
MTLGPTRLDWPVLIRPRLAGFEPTRDNGGFATVQLHQELPRTYAPGDQ